MAPANKGGGDPPSGSLAKAIDERYGSLDAFKDKFNTALAGIQGSGWAWLVQDVQTGDVLIKTYANQDPVVGQFRPLLGIDAWEQLISEFEMSFRFLIIYANKEVLTMNNSLDYQNRKAEYFKAIWTSSIGRRLRVGINSG